MTISDKKLHLYGLLISALFFCIFFLMEMFFSPWKISYLPQKVILVTLFFTIGIWQPTHWVIMQTRRRKQGIKYTWIRFKTEMLILVPYSLVFAVARVYLENYFLLWGVEIDFPWYYTWTAGTVLLFILLQVAVYEGVYFLKQWKTTILEAEELKRLNIETKFDALKVQIQPHFLFNSLNALIALAEFNPRKAVVFTQDLARMYRYFLDVSSKQFISLEDELDFTKTYLSLLKTRYDEGLFMEVSAPGNLDDYMLPPLSLQLLVENAIKHNTISHARPLHIRIGFDFNERSVIVRNNIQHKSKVIKTGTGLLHLKKKFQLLGLRGVEVCENSEAKEFIVKVPFIEATESVAAN